MHDFTATWAWPQWAFITCLFLHFTIQSAKHGQQMLETAGDNKGEPLRYSGFMALGRIAIMSFILIAGGFFA